MSAAPDIEALRAAFDSVPTGSMLLGVVRDETGALVDLECRFINRAAARALGSDSEASVGRRVIGWLADEEAHACLRAAEAVLAAGEPVEAMLGPMRVRWAKAGEDLSVHMQPCPFVNADVSARVLEVLDEVRTTGRAVCADELLVQLDLDGDGVPEDHYFRFTCAPVIGGGEVNALQTIAFEVSPLVEGRLEAEELARRLAENITERESVEAALREQVRQKDELLAMLGHELRNPLAAIRSASEVLASIVTEGAALPRVRQVIERQTLHMARLLDELLDLTRVRSGRLNIEPITLDLREVVREVLSELGPRVREHHFTVDVPARPLWVQGDRARLAQVVHTLIENALKYTPARGEVSVRLQPSEGGAVLTVSDTGVGIEPELRSRLFRPFQQAPQGLARSSGGLGLGLAMSKTIVELHHGTIEARSEGRGRGSELEVWLPLAEPEHDAEPTPGRVDEQRARRARGARRARIMLIEDNEDAAELFAALLRARGHEVYIAGRGREGLEAMEHWWPDAVICDIGLPDIDGYAVARAIRRNSRLDGVQLLALSGYGQDEDRRRSVEAGFDVHFTKPTNVEDILAKIHVPTTEMTVS